MTELEELKQRRQRSWKDRPSKFSGIDRVREAAIYYEKHGVYCEHPKGTKDFKKFWEREQERCRYGYVVDLGKPTELYVTGYHYFYLNYCPIERIVEETLPDGSVINTREFLMPNFYDGDWEYFMAVEEARRTGKHMAVLKARRKGYSYKAASMMCCNYFHKPRSKNFVFVSHTDYLDEDGILNKCWPMMGFVDDHTAWTQPKLVDRNLHKQSGYYKMVNGMKTPQGLQSQIIGVSLNNDPEKIRGKAGDLMFFEEAGKFPGLHKAWDIALPTVKQGNKVLGIMVAFGTGGTEGNNFDGLENLFYECKASTTCGWFIENAKNLEGFMDDQGNSLIEAAREFGAEERANKKTSSNQAAYDQFVAERPNNPREALLQSSQNLFPTAELAQQETLVRTRELWRMGTPGTLVHNDKGVVIFEPDRKLKPIDKFPHNPKGDKAGCAVIYETPYRDDEGKVPAELYIIGHDPYAQDSSTESESLGAAYVLKRPNKFSRPDDMIVASYIGRPQTQDQYNEILFNLAEYYNAKIGFENDRGNVIEYARRTKRLHYLAEEFQMLHKKELQSKKVKRNFGMHMTKSRKEQGEIYIRDWLLEVRQIVSSSNKGKEEIRERLHNYNALYELPLIKELLKFNHKGNFDRVMALMIAMYYMKELYSSEPKIQEASDLEEFFEREFFQ